MYDEITNDKLQITNLKKKIYHLSFIIINSRRRRPGFTLIELLVSFSILAMLAVVGVAAFVNYSNSQRIVNAMSDLRTTLINARSLSFSQSTVGTGCYGSSLPFQGYKVLVCCPSAGSGCPCISSATRDYEIDAVCGGSSFFKQGTKLPANVSVNTTSTTSRSFFFKGLSGGVDGAGQVALQDTQTSVTKIATVSATGAIQ